MSPGRPAKDLSAYDLQRLASRHARGRGESIESLAGEVGVSPAVIKGKLQKAGYVVSTRTRWINAELKRLSGEIVRRYRDEECSVNGIQTFLRERDVMVSPARVRELLKSHGVTLRKNGSPWKRTAEPQRKPGRAADPLLKIVGREEELARRILDGGESVRALAEELDVDHIKLSTALKDGGHLPEMNLNRYRALMRSQGNGRAGERTGG